MKIISLMNFFAFTLLIALSVVERAEALPVFDTAIGTPSVIMVTVVPDSEDKNLYYVFPRAYELARNKDGSAIFSYYEYQDKRFHPTKGRATMSLLATFADEELDQKVSEIRKINPKATFSVVAITASHISQEGPSPILFAETKCQPTGGVFGQEVGCELEVLPKQRARFVRRMRKSLMGQVYFAYTFNALSQGKVRELHMSIPVKFGELGPGDYFFDKNGDSL